MRTGIIAALLLTQILFNAYAEDSNTRAVLINDARLATLKKRITAKSEPTHIAWKKLKANADAALNEKPKVPAVWHVPGYYSDKDGHMRAKQGLEENANTAYELALAYRITGNEKYASAAAVLINAWATQIQTLKKNDDSTLSFSYHFPALIFAADLIRRSPSWPESNQQAFKKFLRERAVPMNCMEQKNNWGNWGLVLFMASAAHLRDDDMFEKGLKRWKELLQSQQSNDGTLTHEVTRGGGQFGLWYSHFCLMPQTICAEIARVNGVDLYEYKGPNGESLRRAYERLLPWVKEPSSFPYFIGNTKDLVGVTYMSYFEILNAHWPSEDASVLLRNYRPLSARHSLPVLTFTHGDLLNDQ